MEQRPAKRRRTGDAVPDKPCPHCGRAFRRLEHLERHVRIHTKEKPFVCQCGAAYTRRDLLTRHQKLASPSGAESSSGHTTLSAPTQNHASDPSEPDAAAETAAAASLSGMSMNSWSQSMPLNHRSEHGGSFQPVPHVLPHQEIQQPLAQPLLAHDFFDNSKCCQDVTGFDHFREFANFIDGVGLPAEWSPYFQGPDFNEEVLDNQAQPATGTSTPGGRNGRPGTPFGCWLPSVPGGSRIADPYSDTREEKGLHPLRVNDEQRAYIQLQLEAFQDVISPDFRLPSRHALTRYVISYFQGWHLHMPFLHEPTWRIIKCPVELVLAVATVGAQYSFEHRVSEKLFYAAKAVLAKRLESDRSSLGIHTSSFLATKRQSHLGIGSRSSLDEREPPGNPEDWRLIDAVSTLVILMGYATWEVKGTLLAEAFSLQSLLVQVLRDVGLHEDEESIRVPTFNPSDPASLHSAWLMWANQESSRRSKLIAFTFLHTHSVAYNVYPVLRTNEVNLRLPCATREWKAHTAEQWQLARQNAGKEQLNFQAALSSLLRHSEDSAAPLDPIPTPLGNYVLLHCLLQRIHIVRDLSLPIMDQTASLPAEEVIKLERALRLWTSGWQQAPESSLDPNNENGPIPFTSSSLLGLAYVRIYLNLGPYRFLESRDPTRIAKALSRSPKVERSDGLISALLYSAHALSIPVRLGIERVARSQAFFWSVRHSLSGFECAVLLSKWLFSLEPGTNGTTVAPLTDSEDRILHWTRYIIDEACAVVDFEEDAPEHAVTSQDPHRASPSHLALSVLRIWSHFFKGNTQWPFINMLGKSLQLYREMLLTRSGVP
ncbi:uncharacterized protein B0I36DRAFT_239299 [Microdochium trichocladiopsis]|uniref:C2H2-type domain-containing protein n=1 Tax=Microdochium trichocladiopsis TaxID=1682393 RepID=A0A9P8YBA1_9PEZI|nr:uncharacterized protein B0I36DRAFT_239299 [Microdochium trichocladiopsis]KAH7034715.1 hypothetical protein B0I36DRAFT_239299 [Microdochium trichocladiopsis]